MGRDAGSGRANAAQLGEGRRNVLLRAKRLRQLLDDLPESDDPAELLAHILNPDHWEFADDSKRDLATADMNRLRAEAERILEEGDEEEENVTLDELVQRLRYRIATREPLGEEEKPDVRIVTLWGAKA